MDGKLNCGPDEVAVCLDRCVPLGGEGDPCSIDPCATETLCTSSLTCLDGQCTPTPAMALLECDPERNLGEEHYCGGSSYCADLELCALNTPIWLEGIDATGMCVLPQREGERCDTDWGQLVEGTAFNRCQVCEPGTECRPHPERDILTCQRRCDDDSNACPCGVECLGEFCDMPCLENRTQCSDDGVSCCDPASECVAIAVPALGAMTISRSFCCHGTEENCELDSDCCPNAICSGTKCETCGSYPGAAPTEVGCCPGLVERERPGLPNVCGLPCEHTGEVCRRGYFSCETEDRYTCDPIQGDVCPDAVVRTEGDDCVNNDFCVDIAAHEPGGPTYHDIPGLLSCEGEGWSCVPRGDAYCVGPGPGCGDAHTFNPYECPALMPGVECVGDEQCAPGWYCFDSGIDKGPGPFCRPCISPTPTCWPSSARSEGCTDYPGSLGCDL